MENCEETSLADSVCADEGVCVSTETNSPADAALVQAARERYESALQRYALRQLAGDRGPVKEILAGVWKDFQALPADEMGEQAGEWLFLSCRRRILILQGKGQAKHFDTGGSAEGEGSALAGAAVADENEEPYITMQRLIDRLTPKQQETVRLRFQNDFSIQQIAGIAELTSYNVGALVHNAMARLGREYRKQHPAEAAEESKGIGDDVRLTLYALGEMEDDERRVFEDSLIDKKGAAIRADEVRAIGTVIGQTLAIEAGAPAPHTVRKRKRNGLALWLGFPRVLIPVAGIVGLGLLIFFGLQKAKPQQSVGPQEKVDFRLKPANWKEGDPLPDETAGKAGGAGGTGGAAPSAHGSSKTGALGAARLTVRGESVEKSSGLPTQNEEQALIASSEEAPANDETSQQDGLPTGSRSSGVSAVMRGKTGDTQAVARAKSTGAEGEKYNSGDIPPAIHERKESAVEAANPGSTKSEARKTAQMKAKTPGPGMKSKVGKKERPFASPKDAGTSVLPPDVEAHSVGVLRKALVSGRLPAPKTVKVEELINYFPIASKAPTGSDLFAATLEASEAPWDPKRRLVRVSLRGKPAPAPVRGAASLILLVDISGSMSAPNRLPLVKEAVRLVVGRLRPDDRVGLVTYAAEPRLALLPTPVADAQEILQAFEGLEAKGATNGGAGMELAYDLAKAHSVPDGRNCVIMCTDGEFNSGPTREEELAKIIERQKDSGVRLSIYGFGRGRQIDARLEKLAMRGGGASGYINTRREAEQVLTGEIDGIFSPLARELEVKVVFNPDQVEGYRLLGYDEPTDVVSGKVIEAPQRRTVLPGHTLTALYEIIPIAKQSGLPEGDLLGVQLSYKTPEDGASHQQDFTLRDKGTTFAESSLDFKFAATVGAFGLVLSDQAPGDMTLDTVEAWAKDCLGDDVGGYRSEFLAMVREARAVRE